MATVTNALNPSVAFFNSTHLDALFMSLFNTASEDPTFVHAEDGLVFHNEPSGQGSETLQTVQGPGALEQRGEGTVSAAGEPQAKYINTFVHQEWAKHITIGGWFFDDEQFAMIESAVRKLAMNARAKKDELAMLPYLQGLAATATIGDGQALFSNSHPILGGTEDNLLTSVLNESALNDAIVMLLEQQGLDGVIQGFTPDFLLVTPTNKKRAQILLQSMYRPATSNNDINQYASAYNIVVKQSPYLGAQVTSGDNDFWVLGSQHHAVYVWDREPIKTKHIDRSLREDDTQFMEVSFRQSQGAVDWTGLIGSTGATGSYDA
jgi:hypothetical protein